MIGMPINAAVLPGGMGTEAHCEIMSAVRAKAAPVISPSGMITEWTDVPEIILAICGAMMPMKPIGPQNAVTVPVIMLHDAIAKKRTRPVGTPDNLAYSSPNRTVS